MKMVGANSQVVGFMCPNFLKNNEVWYENGMCK